MNRQNTDEAAFSRSCRLQRERRSDPLSPRQKARCAPLLFFFFFFAATQVSMATQILFTPCERSSPSQLSVCSLKAKRMPRIQLPHNNNVPIEAGAERGQSILASLAPGLGGRIAAIKLGD